MKKIMKILLVVVMALAVIIPLNTKEVDAAGLKVYEVNAVFNDRGVYKVRCNYLAPVGFSWADNGIPLALINFTNAYGSQTNIDQKWNGRQTHFTMDQWSAGMYGVHDSGIGGYNYGYYWRKINSSLGSFWVSAWSITDLYY